MVNKKVKATTVTLALIFLMFEAGADLGKANFIIYCPEYIIYGDGTSNAPPDLLSKSGDTYYLTRSTANCSFTIRQSNIVFDGQGHTVDGSIDVFGYSNVGIQLSSVFNVTVRNVTVQNFWDDNIGLTGCSGCTILGVRTHGNSEQPLGLTDSSQNVIAQSDVTELLLNRDSTYNSILNNRISTLWIMGTGNTVTRNNITGSLLATVGYGNLFYENNIFCRVTISVATKANSWDNGSAGNYWNDYLTQYPTATEIGSTGIGNTSYVLDVNNIDRYPSIAPVNTSIAADGQNPLPTADPTPAIPELPSPQLSCSLMVIALLAGVAFHKVKKGTWAKVSVRPPN